MLALRAAVAACILTGCTTTIDVARYQPGANQKGIHYWLPATFLLVTPQADGTVTYAWKYLPNSDEEYVINQSSFLSAFTFDMHLENGLLTTAGEKQDSSAVAKDVASQLGMIGSAYVKQAATAAAASTPKVQGGNQLRTVISAARVSQSKPTSAFGPVLLRVMVDGDTVRMIPVSFNGGPGQIRLETNALAAQANGNNSHGAVSPAKAVTLTCTEATASLVHLVASSPIFAPLEARNAKVHKGVADGPDAGDSKSLHFDGSKVTVEFQTQLAPGTYVVILPYSPKRDATPADMLSANAICDIK